MSGVLLAQVGTIDVLDLDVICEFFGLEFLPFPFMFTQTSRFNTQDEASAYTTSVPDRFNHGDLSFFAECAQAYAEADIWVECHVQFIPPDTPSERMVACRKGQLGFFGAQRPDVDAIDIYSVSPYDLGAAISDAVPLTRPGLQPRIIVPEYAPRPLAEFDSEIVVRDRSDRAAETIVPAADVSAFASVQSHWRPTRQWGTDPGKQALTWVRVVDDGDYIYTPDHSHAKPMTKAILRERIDQLIAEDIAILREFRRD